MAKRLRDDSQDTDDPGLLGSRRNSEEPPSAHTPKYTELEIVEDPKPIMECTLPPHKPLKFRALSDYETHYNQAHTNRCRDCRSNFPTAHFLDLHLAENHDPIVATRRERGEKTLACFVEGCEKVCGDWTKRRRHLVDKHCFPRNYDFLVVDHGIDGRRSMLRRGVDLQGHRKSSRERRGSSGTETTRMTEATSVGSPGRGRGEPEAGGLGSGVKSSVGSDVKGGASASKDGTVDELTRSMSSLKFVPSSVTFGKRKPRAGFAKS